MYYGRLWGTGTEEAWAFGSFASWLSAFLLLFSCCPGFWDGLLVLRSRTNSSWGRFKPALLIWLKRKKTSACPDAPSESVPWKSQGALGLYGLAAEGAIATAALAPPD